MASQTLVVPFLTDDPVFACGVEFGMLYTRMRDSSENVIDDLFLIENQEQITLAANRLGWRIMKIKRWGKDWFRCRMKRR